MNLLLLDYLARQKDVLSKKETKTETTVLQLNCHRVVALLRGDVIQRYLSRRVELVAWRNIVLTKARKTGALRVGEEQHRQVPTTGHYGWFRLLS